MIVDLTPTRTNTGASRLLAMVEGRSKQALKTWLQQQSETFREEVEIVAMDGFAGYKTAAVESIDDVVTVMDPFYADVWVMPMLLGGCWLSGAVTA